MRAFGQHHRTIALGQDGQSVVVVDQTRLPHAFEKRTLRTSAEIAVAIRTMVVRGAPLIGVTAAFGMWLALRQDASDAALREAAHALGETRPTAVNLAWALARIVAEMSPLRPGERAAAAMALAVAMADEDAAACEAIGRHGADLLHRRFDEVGRPATFHVLTHCNAGWLATVDWGTALSPLYRLHDEGLALHVWVDETRPRNQGLLTQWELAQHGVPCTLIVDNAGGLLMQRGRVHACIVGADRIAANGDVCNKVGTYLKALAAHEHGVPFYAAVPSTSIDWTLSDGVKGTPIEQRSAAEVGELPAGTAVSNYAFDVTPAKFMTGLITERGVCEASREGLRRLFP